MPFLNPGFLVLFGLLLPVFAFYFLKSKPVRKVVPSNHIWKIVFSRIKPNSFFQRFQNSLFLLLQTIAICLVVLATARPSGFSSGLTRLIVVDVSASMQAGDVAPSRFQAAVARAKALCEGFRGRLGLATLGDQLRMQVQPVAEPGLILRALEKLTPQHSATPTNDAVLRALRDLEGFSPDEIFVLTDTVDIDVPGWFLPKTAINVEVFGTAAENIGIAEAETAWDDVHGAMAVSLGVVNDNNQRAAVTLDLRGNANVDGFPVSVDLGPRERATVALPPIPLKKAVVVLRAPAALNSSTADDEWFLCDPELKPRVLVQAPPDSILFRLKQALPLIEFEPWTPQTSNATSAAAFLSKGEPDDSLRSLSGGAFLPGGGSGLVLGEILPWDREHPLFRFTNWDGVAPEVFQPGPLPGIPLLETIKGPLVTEEFDGRPGNRQVRFRMAFDPDHPALNGNLFLPVFLHNLIAATLQDSFPRLSYRVNDPALRLLGKNRLPQTAGFHRLPGNEERWCAVNLQNPSEVKIEPAPQQKSTLARKAGLQLKEQESSPWEAFLSLALVVVLGEWYLFLRRN